MEAAMSPDDENDDLQYLLPARISVYDTLSTYSPVYHDFKEIVSAPGNSVSRIGPDVRAFIKRAAFALQKYFYGAKVVF